MDVEEKCKTTSHVLNVSANLMGICFILLTSIKLLGKAEATIVDEICGVAIVLFMTSCIFSFLSLRIFARKKLWLETAADVVLLLGLLLLLVTAILFSFNIIK